MVELLAQEKLLCPMVLTLTNLVIFIMALQLNKLPLDIIEEDLEDSLEIVDMFWPKAQQSQEDYQLNYKVTTCASEAGYMSYQQEDISKSKINFCIAAESASKNFYYQPEPTEPEQTRNPWSFFSTMNLVICFGSDNDINALNQVAEKKYHNYPTESDKAQCQFLADSIAAIKSYLSTGTIDSGALSSLLEDAYQSNRNKEEQTFVVPVVKGLNALINNNEDEWQAAIQESLDAHLREVKTGDYKKSHEGFICMPGLALIKLGAKKGWSNSIDSLYLPTQLLDL
jgi:hypothetical protein